MSEPAIQLPEEYPGPKVIPDLVRVLERYLELAKAGSIVGVAIIGSGGPDVVTIATCGAFPSTLAVGCHKAARQLEDNMFQGKRSPILRPNGPAPAAENMN